MAHKERLFVEVNGDGLMFVTDSVSWVRHAIVNEGRSFYLLYVPIDSNKPRLSENPLRVEDLGEY